jgi:hypothetical protein
LEFGFDDPVHGAAGIGCKEEIVAVGVDVFSVNEKTVHIEKTGSDWRKARGVLDGYKLLRGNLLCSWSCHLEFLNDF